MVLGYGQGLALLRIGFGVYYLVQGFAKLQSGWLASPEILLNQFLTGPNGNLTRNTVEPFYRPFLENVVVPNAALFAQLVALGELAVGLSLVLGLGTRLGGLGGAWLNLHYMLLKGLASGGGSNDRLFFVADLIFVLTAAGLVWGLDGAFRHVFASNPLTRWLTGSTASAGEPGSAPARA